MENVSDGSNYIYHGDLTTNGSTYDSLINIGSQKFIKMTRVHQREDGDSMNGICIIKYRVLDKLNVSWSKLLSERNIFIARPYQKRKYAIGSR